MLQWPQQQADPYAQYQQYVQPPVQQQSQQPPPVRHFFAKFKRSQRLLQCHCSGYTSVPLSREHKDNLLSQVQNIARYVCLKHAVDHVSTLLLHACNLDSCAS